MVKQTQEICWQQPANGLNVFDHCVVLAHKDLKLFSKLLLLLKMQILYDLVIAWTLEPFLKNFGLNWQMMVTFSTVIPMWKRLNHVYKNFWEIFTPLIYLYLTRLNNEILKLEICLIIWLIRPFLDAHHHRIKNNVVMLAVKEFWVIVILGHCHCQWWLGVSYRKDICFMRNKFASSITWYFSFSCIRSSNGLSKRLSCLFVCNI